MKKEIVFGLALTVLSASAFAGVADQAGQVIDKSATGAKTGTDSGETKTNTAITTKAGDNVVTQAATGKVTTGAKKTKKGTDAGAAKAKKAVGIAGTAEQKATTTVNQGATDLKAATAK